MINIVSQYNTVSQIWVADNAFGAANKCVSVVIKSETVLYDRRWLVTGPKNGRLCGFFANLSLYGFGVAYVVTSAISIRCVVD